MRFPARRATTVLAGLAAAAAVALAGSTPAVAAASDLAGQVQAGQAQAHPISQFRDNGLHAYTLQVRSVHVHDDGDPGAYGEGDFQNITLGVNLDKHYVAIDNGNGWYYGTKGNKWQKYGSDKLYLTPEADNVNSYQNAAKVGSALKITIGAFEIDSLAKNATFAGKTASYTIPAAGSYKDYEMEIEGTNGKSHVRMTITFRITTS